MIYEFKRSSIFVHNPALYYIDALRDWLDGDGGNGRARVEYETKYTPEENYRQLISTYERAIRERRGGRSIIFPMSRVDQLFESE